MHLSDNANLMEKFLSLSLPRMFTYGEQNSTLSYLSHLERNGVGLAKIPYCGHFAMYSNVPVLMSATFRSGAEQLDYQHIYAPQACR